MSVLPSNLDTWDRAESPEPRTSALLRTPKSQVLAIFVVLVALAAPAEKSWGLLIWQVASAVAAACLLDAPFLHAETGRWPFPTSALLTGLIVAMILAPGGSSLEPALASAVAILGKRAIRTGREQVFNPAALGLLSVGLVLGGGQNWWGALANLPWPWIAVVLASGAFIADRLNKFPLVLAFGGSYFGLWTLASFADPRASAEMFREPFLQSALFLAFFMLTDPPTSPNRYGDQVWFGLLAAGAAFAAQLFGAGQLFLLAGVLVANGWLAARRLLARQHAIQPEGRLPRDYRRAY